jgi:hypothetical protein
VARPVLLGPFPSRLLVETCRPGMIAMREAIDRPDISLARSAANLEFARTARISAFPAQFSSISRIIRNFANLEFNGRPADYYSTYEERYAAVTLDDISRVANKYLNPDRMIIMISGNIEECRAGADRMLPNQQTIDGMAEAFGGRTIDGLAEKYGDGEVHILRLK